MKSILFTNLYYPIRGCFYHVIMNGFNNQCIKKLYLSMSESAMASYNESSDWLNGFETYNLDYILTKLQTHI